MPCSRIRKRLYDSDFAWRLSSESSGFRFLAPGIEKSGRIVQTYDGRNNGDEWNHP
jgi:hypothetical protein